jgi:hypothetical protein
MNFWPISLYLKVWSMRFWTLFAAPELVIHNASFDVGFINHELTLLNRGLGVINGLLHGAGYLGDGKGKASGGSERVWMHWHVVTAQTNAIAPIMARCWTPKYWQTSISP